MQQIKPVQGQSLSAPLPAQKTTSNKVVYPVQSGGQSFGLLSKANYGKDGTEPIYSGQPVVETDNHINPAPTFNATNSGAINKAPQQPGQTATQQPNQMPPKPGVTPTGGSENSAAVPPKPGTGNQGGGNQGAANPNAQYMVPSQSAPSVDFQGKDFVSNGYTGVQGDKEYAYDPNDKSLVQNQITGLLDPNSDIMKKAIANAQAYSASRGLQSSSIGNEAALSSMIDKALPIAQQDAQTYNQAQTLGWNNNFTSDQANLTREHDASMADKQGDINNQVQNNQMEWQSGEKVADRQFQTQLADLQYKQSLGTLDKQQSLQLAQMEKTASIQTERDSILNKYQVELNDLQYDQRWKELNAQIDSQVSLRQMELSHDMRTQYGNSIGEATNAALNAIGLAMNNPNMTKEQQSAAVQEIMNSLYMQTNMMGVLYGAMPPSGDIGPYPPVGGVNVPSPQVGNPAPTTSPGTSINNGGGTTNPNSPTSPPIVIGGGGVGGTKPLLNQN